MEPDSLKEKTAKGLFWGAMNNLFTQILTALFGIALANRLGQEEYGIVGMLTIFTSIATSLQDSGFVTALVNKRNIMHRDYNSVFWFNISVSLSLYVILFFCAPLISLFFEEPLLTSLARYVFLGFFIASFNIVPRAVLFKQMKQKELAKMGFVSLIISNCTGIALVYSGFSYWGYATQSIVFNLCVSITSWYLSGWRPSSDVSFKPIKEMFGFSSKMLMTNIIININDNIFSVLLSSFYTKREVGNYTQANKWNLMGAKTISGMVQGVAQPTFVAVGDDKERLCRTFRKMLRFTCFLCFPLMFGLSLIAPEFIVILIKERWLPSANLMRILCVAGAFLPIATLYYNLIISRGKSNIYMYNIIAQCVIILMSTIFVVKCLGAVDIEMFGMQIHLSVIKLMLLAYTAIIITWTFIWHYFLRREIGIPYSYMLKDIVPFFLLAAATMIGTYIVTLPITNIFVLLLSRVVLAAIIYVGCLWMLGTEILRECLSYVFKKK